MLQCAVCLCNEANIKTYPCRHTVICRPCFIKSIKSAIDQRTLPIRCIVCRCQILRARPLDDQPSNGIQNHSRWFCCFADVFVLIYNKIYFVSVQTKLKRRVIRVWLALDMVWWLSNKNTNLASFLPDQVCISLWNLCDWTNVTDITTDSDRTVSTGLYIM